MASTYSPNLKIELIASGEQSGVWGDTTNTNLGDLIEEAIAGFATQAVTDGAATVLTIPDGAASVGRNYVIELTGTLTANRAVEVPAVDKPYTFFNNTTGGFSVTVKVSGGTGVTIANGKKAIVYANSIDVIEVANAPVTEDGTQTLTNKTIVGGSWTATSPSSISVNSTSDAFRITQTNPTGNAFVVEDSASTDTTPFVIDNDGNVVVGAASIHPVPAGDGGNRSVPFQVQGNLFTKATLSAVFYNPSAGGGGTVSLARSNTTAIGSHSVVASGDVIGSVFFSGSDGTAFVRGAQITANVDGTPGLNDMPGRIVLSTTADGAATPTERMRITSAGNVGIGTSAPTYKLDVSSALGNVARITNGASGATPSNTHGEFIVESADGNMGLQFLGTATSNQKILFGDPGSNASGQITYDHTSDFMSLSTIATERMRIDSAGNVAIGGTPQLGRALSVVKNPTGSVATYNVIVGGAIQPDVTGGAHSFLSNPSTASSNFNLANLYHYHTQATTTFANVTAGGQVSNQYGFSAGSSLVGATNNYGFYGNIPSATGRWNFYANGTAQNYFAGDVGLGVAVPLAKLHFSGLGETTAPTVGGSKAATIFLNSSGNLPNIGGAIEFGGQTNTTFAAWKGGLNTGADNTIGYLAAYTRQATTDAAMTERMRITQDGNIGIATTTPTQKLDINDDSIRVRTAKTPASATATGTQGQIAWDADYVYVCTATNVWKRTAITTW